MSRSSPHPRNETPLRSDALQRRKNILREARRLFAEVGREVSLDAIAVASNVGIATLYRNFPSREELINGVTLDVVFDLNESLARIRATPVAPEGAWKRFVSELAVLHLGALTEVLGGSDTPILTPEVLRAQQNALNELERELQELKQHGCVREDLTAASVVAAIAVLTRPHSEMIRRTVPELPVQLMEAYLDWSRPRHLAR